MHICSLVSVGAHNFVSRPPPVFFLQNLRRVMLELESRCSELTGSLSIQTARRAIEIRQQLPTVLDLGLLSALVAGLATLLDLLGFAFALPHTLACSQNS